MCDHDGNADPRHRGLSRRQMLVGSLAAGALPLLPALSGTAGASGDPGLEGTDIDPTVGSSSTRDYAFLPPRPASEKHVRPIMFPVLPDPTLGKATYTDTYLAPRSGGRLHEGEDLMGKKMLKLLAVTDATVAELRWDSGGNSLYLEGDDGWYYCYLHINNDDPGTDNGANQFKYAFAPGMEIGKRVLKGEHVAYLGDSGNAESVGSHCHFEIRMPNTHWYNAAAVNPMYSLDASAPAKLRPKVPASAFAPLSGAPAFTMQQAADFLGAVPPSPWFDHSVEALEGAEIGLDAFIEGMLDQTLHKSITEPLIRLYLGFFLRVPDYGGLDYWIRKVRAGTPIATAASTFAAGSEFNRRYGSVDNAGFVKLVYNNLFGRNPDASGADYWKRRLDGGMKRGAFMVEQCESNEYRTKTLHQMRVISIYTAMLHRSPDSSGYSYWSGKDASSATGLQQLIKSIRTGTSYAARF
jgi:murein DD-endopeptidase MepM/ murein hydrolase activator NlpD